MSRAARQGEANQAMHDPEEYAVVPDLQAQVRAEVQKYADELVSNHAEMIRLWAVAGARAGVHGEGATNGTPLEQDLSLVRRSLQELLDGGKLRGVVEDVAARILSGDRGLSREWLAALVRDSVAQQVQAGSWRDGVGAGSWERAFALAGAPGAVDPLPPVRAHIGGNRSPGQYLNDAELERSLLEYVENDPYPLPHTSEREAYLGDLHFDYWASGLRDYLGIKRTLRRLSAELRQGDALLDLGCATGRVLRHFLCQEPSLDVWGAELNRAHVEWVSRHLPKRLRAIQTTVLPRLPLPDASLSLVYAFSVFTHVDEFECEWMAELRRVLRPGGIAYITVQTEDTWKRNEPGTSLHQNLLHSRDPVLGKAVTPELLRGPMPRPKTVYNYGSGANYRSHVFLSKEHIRDRWGRFLDLVEILPQASFHQDVAVLRRP